MRWYIIYIKEFPVYNFGNLKDIAYYKTRKCRKTLKGKYLKHCLELLECQLFKREEAKIKEILNIYQFNYDINKWEELKQI